MAVGGRSSLTALRGRLAWRARTSASPTAVPRRRGALRRADRITSLSVVGSASTLGAPAKVTRPTWNRSGISSRKASAASRAASMRVGDTSVLSIDCEVVHDQHDGGLVARHLGGGLGPGQGQQEHGGGQQVEDHREHPPPAGPGGDHVGQQRRVAEDDRPLGRGGARPASTPAARAVPAAPPRAARASGSSCGLFSGEVDAGWGDGGQDGGEEAVGGDLFGQGLVGQDQAVAQDVAGEFLDVLGQAVAAAPEHGQGAGGRDQVDRASGAGAIGDVAGEVGEVVGGGVAGGVTQGDGVLGDQPVDIDRWRCGPGGPGAAPGRGFW